MSGRNRTIVGALILLSLLAIAVLIAFAGNACPVETAGQPCPEAPRNVVIAVAMAALAAGLLVTPFAFLGEVISRRRIVYRGAWGRAARRGVLVGLTLATLAGLRLAGVLSVPIALFIVILAAVVEWFLARRDP
jgi:MFS family permease